MMRFSLGFCIALGLLFGSKAVAVTGPKFEQAIHDSKQSQKRFLEELQSKDLNRFDYVLIPGFLNETLPTYFSDWVRTYYEAGVEEGHLFVLRPDSNGTIKENARKIESALRKIFKKNQRQLVVISHSKGAVEVLWAALHRPDFWASATRSIFLIQGPFGGSYIADYVQGVGVEPDDHLSWAERLLLRIERSIASTFSLFLQRGLKSLMTNAASKMRIEMEDLGIEDRLKEKMHFIVSHEKKSAFSQVIQNSGLYLSSYYGESDGLILLDHQALKGFGRVLSWLEADHVDLAFDWPLANGSAKNRKALAQAILANP